MDHLFGILDLDHWDLFVIWFLVLGIFMIFIKKVILVKSEIRLDNHFNRLASSQYQLKPPGDIF